MRRALLLAALAAVPLATLAQNIDMSQGGPVDVTATDGIEWRQAEQVVIARGNARAVRAGVTVEADRLLARYRPAGQQAGQQAGRQPGQPPASRPAGRRADGCRARWQQ
jgi:lipopolysaccharide export system protein LptA